MQLVLERWGRWAAGEENCSMVDWPSVSVLPGNHIRWGGQPGCSDEDGITIDSCIAQMSLVCPREEVIILGLRFIGGRSTRSIARIMQTDRNLVRARLRASEAFLEGILVALGITLDMDPEVQTEEKLVGTRKPVLLL